MTGVQTCALPIFSALPDQVHPQLDPLTRVGGQVPVQPLVDQPKPRDDDQGQQDEIPRQDRIRHKGVERLVCEIARIIKRIPPLLPDRTSVV